MKIKEILANICWSIRAKIWYNGILRLPHKIRALKLKYKRGFSCCDTSELFMYFSKNIYRGLLAFKEDLNKFPCYPSEIETFEEWCEIIDQMIEGFRLIMRDDWFAETEEERRKMNLGVELFARHFRDLWL